MGNFYTNYTLRTTNQRAVGTVLSGRKRRYTHDQLHGLSRQWDAKGRLLGSFTMNHGTGTLRGWHENGRPRLETHLMEGKLLGRTRMWLRDGTLVAEDFYLGNVDATRAAYLKAARKRPDWPQYKGEPAGRVAREDHALKRKQHELFMESLLEKSHAEAGKWLGDAKRPDMRSLSRFRTAGAALRFVKSLYAAGAILITALPVYAGKRGKQFADSLLIRLPQTPSRRKALRKLCLDFCDRRGGALLPERDIGENHLFLGLE